jgi:putative redox protein
MDAKVIAHSSKARYRTSISNDRQEVIADEPTSLGGTDEGFAPTELLAAALASCTSITLRMYADRKEWDLTDIKVSVDFSRDTKIFESSFVRRIELIGNLTEEQRSRLLAIANSCPVHRTLTHSISVDSQLV